MGVTLLSGHAEEIEPAYRCGYNPKFVKKVVRTELEQAREDRNEARRQAKELEAEISNLQAEIERLRSEKRLDAIEFAVTRQKAIDAIQDAIVELRSAPAPSLSGYDAIERRICRALHVKQEELHGKRRHSALVLARAAVSYWACRRTNHSLAEIGRRIGVDHTTVLHHKRAYPDKRRAMGRTLRKVR